MNICLVLIHSQWLAVSQMASCHLIGQMAVAIYTKKNLPSTAVRDVNHSYGNQNCLLVSDEVEHFQMEVNGDLLTVEVRP